VDTDDFFEQFWSGLLSREPEHIRAVFCGLDEANQALVIKHLRRMVGEAGWHAEQKKSARAALKAIKDSP
jgi:hypothetical protein